MPTYRLRKRGQVTKRKTPVSDVAYAGDQFDTQFDAWAQIRPLSGQERSVADQLVHSATHEIIIRWPGQDVTTMMQFEIEGETFPIHHVEDINGDGMYLRLLCTSQRVGRGNQTVR